MTSRRLFLGSGLGAGAAAALPPFQARNVRDAGAKGDGSALDTAAIQSAIDACGAAGGGIVFFPPGIYSSGTLVMRSGVTLHLAEAAVIRGSTRLADYPSHVPDYRSYTDNYTEKSLIYAENVERIGIEGKGLIDGQGKAFAGPYKVRPYLMRFIGCRGVTVRDVRIENSPMWVQHYMACEDVRLTGLTVRSRVNANNDGIDIDSCERVRISDCDIISGDDAICLKSSSGRPCRDVAVTNCVVSSHCNGIKFGTESNGGFENVAVSNCALYDTRLGGISVLMVDGGALRNVAISNITMRAVKCPVFVRLGSRNRPYREQDPQPPTGALSDVLIHGVYATGAGVIVCSITGIPGAPVRGITLRDVTIAFDGGGTLDDARVEVPENAAAYPEYNMFKRRLPAYGLYCRHAEGLCLDNLRFSTATDDRRPALLFDDVEDLALHRLHAGTHREAEAAVRMIDVRNAAVRDCAAAGSNVFARVEGPRSARISLAGISAGEPFSMAAGAPPRSVSYRE
jgi:hypothetical protein